MDIVTALGGEKWFNLYCGLFLASQIFIAFALIAMLYKMKWWLVSSGKVDKNYMVEFSEDKILKAT